MLFSTVDQICRRSLLEKGLPVHYYMENLYHVTDCIRQLSIDTLKIVNTAKLPVNSYGAIDLPDDFMDDLGVSPSTGLALTSIPKMDFINPLLNHDSTGAYVPYNTTVDDDVSRTFYGFGGWIWFWNMNDFGEPTGRYFGANAGSSTGYKVVKERRQIQFYGDVGDSVVVVYLSDGQRADNATQVDMMAIDTLKAYRNWKSSPNADYKDSPEGATYYNERRLLRARLNDMTVEDLRDILHRGYKATIKN